MSRTPASYPLQVVRGSTWEDVFIYTGPDKVTPIDLTGYSARMQVRTLAGQYGTSTDDTLVMELTTDNGRLYWDTETTGTLRILVPASDTTALNPGNAKKVGLAYSIELFIPAGASPEYVIPLVAGKISVRGEVTR